MAEIVTLRGDRSQADVGRLIGLSQASVHHAEKDPRPSKDGIRIRIVEALSPVQVRKDVSFVIVPQPEEDGV